MITVPKKVEYSVILIAFMAKQEGKVISLLEMSKKLVLPYRFLGQLAVALKSAKIIESREGKSGGYCLVEGWEKKTLYDLLESLGENKHMVQCLAEGKVCAREAKCRVRSVWDKLEKGLVEELKKIKLIEI